MPEMHTYKHLDQSSPFTVTLSLRDIAEQIEDLNYGTHRFLSHLVDVRREALARRIARYHENGDHDIAESVKQKGDKLAYVIEQLLNEGLF